MRGTSIRFAALLGLAVVMSATANATHCVPTTPSPMTQLNGDSSPLSTGGTTSGGTPTSVILQGTNTASCDQGQQISCEFEVVPTSASFTGTPTHNGTAVSVGAVSSVTVTGLTPGTAYKWQVRENDTTYGYFSSFTAFNGGSTAFVVAGGTTPPSGMPGVSGAGKVAMIVGLAGMLLVLGKIKRAS